MAAGDIALSILINGNASGAIMAMAQVTSASMGTQTALTAVSLIGAAAIVGIGVAAVKMAGDFQAGLTSLVTGAGEAQSNLKMVGDGMLAISTDTGTSTTLLTQAMFNIESSGAHGAAGLQELQAAAEGAKVGNASLAGVTSVLTTSIHDYGLSASSAVPLVNSFIATTKSGNMVMDDLSAALANVLPVASKAGIGITQVEGALATMSAAGVKGADAGTKLEMMIMALLAPSAGASKELKELGLSTQELATAMQTDLPGAVALLTDAIGKRFPVGSAAFVAAEKTIFGSGRNLQAIMDLSGSSMAGFQANVASASAALNSGSGSVTGWAEVQGDLNTQISRAVASIQAFMIVLGTGLLPIITPIVGGFADMVGGLTQFASTGAGMTVIVLALSAALAGLLVLAAGGLKSAFAGAIASLLGTAAATNAEAAASDIAAASATNYAVALKAIAVSSTATAMANGVSTEALIAASVAYDAAAAGAAIDATATTAAIAPTVGLGAALWTALAPIMPFVLAIGALVAAFTLLYNGSSQFRGAIQQIGPLLQQLGGLVQSVIAPVFQEIGQIWSTQLVPSLHQLGAALQPLEPILQALGYLLLFLALGVVGVLAAALIALTFIAKGVVITFTEWADAISVASTATMNFLESIPGWADDAVSGIDAFLSSATGDVISFFASFAKYSDNGVDGINKFLNSAGTAVATWFADLNVRAYNWGANMLNMFIQGVESQFTSLVQSLGKMAAEIESYIGFASPTRLGPGSRADLWAPALVSMFAGGLIAGVPQIQSASNRLAGGISGAFAIGGGNNNAFALPASGGSGNGQGSANIIVQLDSKVLMQANNVALAKEVRIAGYRHG